MGVVYNLLRRVLLLVSGVGLFFWLWRTLFNMSNISFPWKRSISNSSERNESEDFDTDYDSTWEGDNGIKESEGNVRGRRGPERNEYAAKDMQNFRHMLRKVENDETTVKVELRQKDLPNLRFYQNKKRSEPDGVLIEEFHTKWIGKYEKLEYNHSFIQWLFPIQEKGMNWDSYILTKEEIMRFRKDEEVKGRLVKSYKLMLDFYGIKLVDEETGKVRRIKEKWFERFENLNRNTHNNLRITRILKCLGILGFQHYQAPLVRFFLHQTLVKKRLPRVKKSVLDYFLFSVVDKEQRKELIKYAFHNIQPGEEFVWCPKRIQRRFLNEIKPQNTVDSDVSETEFDAEAGKQQLENEGASLNTYTGRMEGTQHDADLSGNESDTEQDQQKLKGPSAEQPYTTAGHAEKSDQELVDDESQTNKSQNGDYKKKAKDLSVVSGGTDTSSQDDDRTSKNSARDLDKMSEKQKSDREVTATGDINRTGDGALAQNVEPNGETMLLQHGGVDTTHGDNSKTGQSPAVEADEMSDDLVSPNPDCKDDNKDGLQGVKNTQTSEEDSQGEDHSVQESTATKDTRRTEHDARESGISSNEDNAMESAKQETKGDQILAKEPPNKDDDDAIIPSGTGADTDTAQNKQPNGNEGTHSEAMATTGTDTTHLDDTKMPAQSSAVEPDCNYNNTDGLQGVKNTQRFKDDKDDAPIEDTRRTGHDARELGVSSNEDNEMEWSYNNSHVGDTNMSAKQETRGDQRQDKEPNKDDAVAMEMETDGDIDTAQHKQPNEDGPDTTDLGDTKMPTQSSVVGTNEMFDNSV